MGLVSMCSKKIIFAVEFYLRQYFNANFKYVFTLNT
jgi:hypothetical protein